jgi:hypothetical protein
VALTIDVAGALTQAGVENRIIADILRALDDSRAQVRKGEHIEFAPAGVYGGALTATELAGHAGRAHEHVVDAMRQMAQGLTRYHESVEHFRADVHETDQTVADDVSRTTSATRSVDVTALLAAGTACTAAQSFRDNPECVAEEEQ